MQCRKCHSRISIVVAVESASKIRRYCEAVGMAPEAIAQVLSQCGPLCRKCMQLWGAGEDDLCPPDDLAGRPADLPLVD
jgi:hypothetical protein